MYSCDPSDASNFSGRTLIGLDVQEKLGETITVNQWSQIYFPNSLKISPKYSEASEDVFDDTFAFRAEIIFKLFANSREFIERRFS